MSSRVTYFTNHDRRSRFPWSLYHGELTRRLAAEIRELGPGARVLVVGCGLEPYVQDAPNAEYWGADLDPASIQTCRERHPDMADRLAVCPGPYELPRFEVPFDAVVAKEVIEHLDDPPRWAKGLGEHLRPGGRLLLTTPNYGRFSTLPILERTLLELVARREGWSRRHIHPSRFDRRSFATLDVGADLALLDVHTMKTGWSLLGRWRKR